VKTCLILQIRDVCEPHNYCLMASAAHDRFIGWAQADVAVQNGTFSLVVDNFGRLK